jgi:hypothetical protein
MLRRELGDVGGDGPAQDRGGGDAQPVSQGDNPGELDGGERHREPGRQVMAESTIRHCPVGSPMVTKCCGRSRTTFLCESTR